MGLVFEGNANLAIALRDSIEGMLVKGMAWSVKSKSFCESQMVPITASTPTIRHSLHRGRDGIFEKGQAVAFFTSTPAHFSSRVMVAA